MDYLSRVAIPSLVYISREQKVCQEVHLKRLASVSVFLVGLFVLHIFYFALQPLLWRNLLLIMPRPGAAAARALLQRSSGGCWSVAVRADAGCCHRPSSDPSCVRPPALQGNLRETQGSRTRQPPGSATMPARSGRVRSSGIGLCRQLTLSGAVAAAAGPELLALPAPEGGTTPPSTSRR